MENLYHSLLVVFVSFFLTDRASLGPRENETNAEFKWLFLSFEKGELVIKKQGNFLN